MSPAQEQKQDNRGTIKNRSYSSQQKLFLGLKYGKITPTDIDGFLDFKNKLFIVIETKHGSGWVPFGQKLAIERIIDNLSSIDGKEAIGIIGRHESNGDIVVGDCWVSEIRWNRKWTPLHDGETVKSIIDKMVEKYVPELISS